VGRALAAAVSNGGGLGLVSTVGSAVDIVAAPAAKAERALAAAGKPGPPAS
jgi:NAD(P)H-dependent flavin oxidoreductase YrpB (nitropropane dioxygenase family)